MLHLLFWYWARGFSLPSSGREVYERIVPRTFHLERVEIDSKLARSRRGFGETEARWRRKASISRTRRLPSRNLWPTTRENRRHRRSTRPFSRKSPRLPPRRLKRPRRWPSGAARKAFSRIPGRCRLLCSPRSRCAAGRPTGKLLDPQALTGRAVVKTGKLRGGDTPGFSNLDDLLARTGPLSSETAPILMPTDLLFDYDQDQSSRRGAGQPGKAGHSDPAKSTGHLHHRGPYAIPSAPTNTISISAAAGRTL